MVYANTLLRMKHELVKAAENVECFIAESASEEYWVGEA